MSSTIETPTIATVVVPRPPAHDGEGDWRGRAIRIGLRLVLGVLILAAFELWADLDAASYVARPTQVIKAIPGVLDNGSWWYSLGQTVESVAEGLAMAVVAGVVIGLAMGRLRVVRWFFTPYTSVLYTLPMPAVVPLLTLWLGYTSEARLAVVGISAFLPIVVSVADGSRRVPSEYLDAAKMLQIPTRNVWFGIALRSSLPFLLAGMEQAVARAVIGAVAAEFLTGVSGAGFNVLTQSRAFHENQAFVTVLALTLIILGMRTILHAIRNRLRWYTQDRS